MKIVITGPESTGKTTLAKALAKQYQINFLPEYAREFLQDKQGNYEEADLLKIAKGQIEIEDEQLRQNPRLTICDTSLEVIRVWAERKYGRCAPFIVKQAKIRIPDLFLILKPDFPWHPDPLRENPDDRNELFNYFQKSLAAYKTPAIEIGGDKLHRFDSAVEAIEKLVLI